MPQRRMSSSQHCPPDLVMCVGDGMGERSRGGLLPCVLSGPSGLRLNAKAFDYGLGKKSLGIRGIELFLMFLEVCLELLDFVLHYIELVDIGASFFLEK